jgi:hypothetical protein
MERGMLPVPGHVDPSAADNGDEDAREAYRRKGRDVVGASGTTRVDRGDLPPPFTAGPSGTTDGTDSATETSEGTTDGALPSFTESEAEMRSGRAPLLSLAVPSQVLQPVAYEENPTPAPVPGELSTWVEYDGYERFSAPPPPAAASFGVASSMDPPREGDEDGDVVGSIVARLGLPSGSAPNPAELMEQLGLGLGTRVVDLVDDLPPGIDEPSLPALPGFAHPSPPATQHQLHPRQIPADHEHPPSFDASEAAEAVGGVARSRVGSMGSPALANLEDSDAPPGYFGGGPPAYS